MTRLAPTILCLALLPSLTFSREVVRHKLPDGSSFPILAAVEIPPGKTLVFLSGMLPVAVNPNGAKDNVAIYGDTRAQTISVLTVIRAELERLHLSMGDVIKMQAFLVGDAAKGGKLDFDGFMQGYTQFFGTPAQPNLPVRSAVQVAALVFPGMMVEIEVTAVRP